MKVATARVRPSAAPRLKARSGRVRTSRRSLASASPVGCVVNDGRCRGAGAGLRATRIDEGDRSRQASPPPWAGLGRSPTRSAATGIRHAPRARAAGRGLGRGPGPGSSVGRPHVRWGPAPPGGMLSETTTIDEPTRPADDEGKRLISDRPRLVLLSFLMLFVELSVIRWSGANVVYLAYFSNLVLLGSFLGIGLGFLWAGRGGRSLFPYAPVVLAAFVAFIRARAHRHQRARRPAHLLQRADDLGPAPRDRAAGHLRDGRHPADVHHRRRGADLQELRAARGLQARPHRQRPRHRGRRRAVVPGHAAGGVGRRGRRHPHRRVAAQGAARDRAGRRRRGGHARHRVGRQRHLVVAVLQDRARPNDHQRRLQRQGQRGPPPGHAARRRQPALRVELRAGHGRGRRRAHHRRRRRQRRRRRAAERRRPHRRRRDRPQALRAGPATATPTARTRTTGSTCTSTTAAPSSSGPDKEWDRILLALPDSLTLVTGQASVRLESYLFTTEAIESARDHLTEGGVFSMYNYYREGWLVDRYANTLDAGVRARCRASRRCRPAARTTSRTSPCSPSPRTPTPSPARASARPCGRPRPTPPSRPPTTTRSPTCARTRCPGSTW